MIESLAGMVNGTGPAIDTGPGVRQPAPGTYQSISAVRKRRVLRHDRDGGLLSPGGQCQDCGLAVPVPEIRIEPGPGFEPGSGDGPLPGATNAPRRLLDPIRCS